MLKSFVELRNIDVKPYCEMREAKDDNGKKIEVPYLNWAKCKDLLHQNGAEKVIFEPVVGANGSSLIMSDAVFTDKNGVTNRCYEVRVRITIDDLVFESQFPLMNGSNPVKDNSLTQQRLWNAQTRAFVKGVAIHTGLGFDLWLNDATGAEQEEDLSKHSLDAIKLRFQQTYTQKLQKHMSVADIAKGLNMTEDEVKVIFTYFDQLKRFETALQKL
ncbi:MAG: DUF1071 domain-containing protein [Clostridia bacterium]|nr:DUF1071 domain-containing protein [Clostridia bacterium]